MMATTGPTPHSRARRKREHAVLLAALLSAMFLAALRAESSTGVASVHFEPTKSFLGEVRDKIVSEVSCKPVESFIFGPRH